LVQEVQEVLTHQHLEQMEQILYSGLLRVQAVVGAVLVVLEAVSLVVLAAVEVSTVERQVLGHLIKVLQVVLEMLEQIIIAWAAVAAVPQKLGQQEDWLVLVWGKVAME
tara:strand:+ start:68 stop:394 length:327 start_codon:yes stop_codon:yes gene_type:complete